MATIDQSPLTQQTRPEVFEPKIVQFYNELFRDTENDDKSEGFWSELFLLPPELSRLSRTLDDTDASFLLQVQHYPQQLLLHGIAAIKAGAGPGDEHALDTLAVFLNKILAKRYQSPSSDIIEVLAGLDHVDAIFTDLVAALQGALTDGRTDQVRRKAVQVAVCVASGAFQTGLLTYFTQRDLFPSLMRCIHDSETPSNATLPFLLVGILANYNKFEVHNPYQARISEFSDSDTTSKIALSIGLTCESMRDQYSAIQNDVPEAWSFGGTLSYVGLGALAGVKPAPAAPTEEEAKALFAEQPQSEATILLSIYEFSFHNKDFCTALMTKADGAKQAVPAFASILSFSSYLLQHAHRSSRAALYARTSLLIMQILVEDSAIVKRVCETTCSVRLCRQRQPFLPLAKGERPLAAAMLDVMVDSMNHNLRKKLDVQLYTLNVNIVLRILSHLRKTRTRLQYHWPELWRSLLSFVKFLTAYAEDLRALNYMDDLVHDLVNVIALSLTEGESFLPDSAAYDDLFYKLVETGDSLTGFRSAYSLDKTPSAGAIDSLIGVSTHYRTKIQEASGKTKTMTPREVSKIIKQGYETLSIEAREGLDHWERYREADFKVELKKIARVVVADARVLGMPR